MSLALTASNVTKSFKQGFAEHKVLHNISMTCVPGKSYGITGVSGIGKSTLLHVLAGLEKPTSGSVAFGRCMSAWTLQEQQVWRAQQIGLLFQQPYLLHELTVLENVMIKGHIAGLSQEVCASRAQELLEAVHMQDAQHLMPAMLSGGQQARVALARALVTRPLFLFADEPTANLDMSTTQKILETLITYQRSWGMALVICSHDADIICALQETVHLSEKSFESNLA
jgi:lipoprotein-releasing system ATP-binding protein